jgi:hypothetical protein
MPTPIVFDGARVKSRLLMRRRYAAFADIFRLFFTPSLRHFGFRRRRHLSPLDYSPMPMPMRRYLFARHAAAAACAADFLAAELLRFAEVCYMAWQAEQPSADRSFQISRAATPCEA